MKRFNSWFTLSFILLAGCGGGNYYTRQNLAYLYKPDEQGFSPSYMVHHLTDTISEFWFSIPSEDLAYVRPAASIPSATKARLSVRAYMTGYPTILKDTATINIQTTETGRDGIITGTFNMTLPGNEVTLEINFWDLNKGTGRRDFIQFKRAGRDDAEYFFVTDSTGKPVFNSWFSEPTQVLISHSIQPTEKLKVNYHRLNFPMPAPPFSSSQMAAFTFRADSNFEVTSRDSVFRFMPNRSGFYHFKTNPESLSGLTFFFPGGSFPHVSTPEEMLEPLRYMLTTSEYDAILSSPNRKQAMDEFWLKAGGSANRAREMIRVFYTRVEYANKYFSSFTEGWKTDRGMMYIIFGPPDAVYRLSTAEQWVYGEENNLMSMKLNFLKVRNPYSRNDFTLERSEAHRVFWNRAIEAWREGRVL